MSEEKEFVWTEELAKEYGKFCLEKHSHLQWEDFKMMKQMPLFKTNDGVEVFPNDSFYAVSDDWKIFFSNATSAKIDYAGRTFSKKELAVEHIIMNKPCLSLQEVIMNSRVQYDISEITQNPHYQKLREIVKQKIQ